ncbi:hypothetical protein QBC43DRAFT_292995 [Cladorrhinum sp. PSN259]|nr:hypothetical protein QBC43DRAFT_292995 [Cladorrhinum sp. PSN259]
MQFKNTIISIASLAAMAQAYIIPTGLKNGIYEVRLNETGDLHPYYIGPELTTASPISRAVRRGTLEYCGGGTRYTKNVMLFVHDSVTAYTCDYTGGQLCFSSEAELAYTQIKNACGLYKSGW